MVERVESSVEVEPSPDPNAIDTLGKLADNGMGLVWYCDDCNRKLGLDLDGAIHHWGRDRTFVGWRPPIVCADCRGRNASMRVQAQVPGRTWHRVANLPEN